MENCEEKFVKNLLFLIHTSKNPNFFKLEKKLFRNIKKNL